MVAGFYGRRAEGFLQVRLAVQAGTIAQGTWLPVNDESMTVAELAAKWLNSNPLKQESSRDRDRSIVENHIKPSLGELNITHVTKARCQELVDNWTDKNHLSASTVVRQVAVLHAVFQYAVDDRKRSDNPADALRLPQEEPTERPYQDLTPEDYDRLAAALGPDDAVMMWLGEGPVGRVRRLDCRRRGPQRGHSDHGHATGPEG